VVATDIILILFVIVLCIQRIAGSSYPCMANLWTSYIGIVILFNTYLWRCWTLYFSFNVTQLRLSGVDMNSANLPFFIKNRFYASSEFLTKFTAVLFLILMIPAIVTSFNPDVQSDSGDSCKGLQVAQVIIAIYVLCYIIAFLLFSIGLRAVVDNFKIKEELRSTGIIGIAAVIVYGVFNLALKDINNKTFPFSTLGLLIAVIYAFYASTIAPLWRSYHAPPKVEDSAVDVQQMETLSALIQHDAGFESFRKFLSAEFSVENLLFWKDIDTFRKKIRDNQSPEFVTSENQRLYAKYIVEDSPFQVNLPEKIVDNVKAVIDGKSSPPTISPSDVRLEEGKSDRTAPSPPTIFDEAQKSIFKLMESDSFPRYKSSDQYRDFVNQVSTKQKEKAILGAAGLA
jgi:hypothetical protein